MSWSKLMVVLLATLPAMAQIVSPPPAVRETKPEPRQTAAIESAQTAAATAPYSIGDPTDEEQLLLEYVNRTRANPAAEALRLNFETLPEILTAYQFFSVDLNKMVTDISALPPAPPLAFQSQLIQAARGHSAWMLANAIQSHFEILGLLLTNNPGDRISAAGYNWQTYGESIYAFAHGAEEAHAAFEVDWGFGPGGMQNPAGHRENNHDASFREAGVGFTHGYNTVLSALLVTNTVGPEQVTIDFGASMTPQPLITGVAYYDVNGDRFYGPGEGLGGLTVALNNLPATGVTANSGGYAVPAGKGTHQVIFSGPGFVSAPISVTITNGENVKADLMLPYIPPVVTGPSQALVGGLNAYQLSQVALAASNDWQVVEAVPYNAVEGAEQGLANVIAQVGAYEPIATDLKASGNASFHLVHVTQDPQIIQLAPIFKAQPGAKITFSTLMGFATADETANLEISTNSGLTWTAIWSQSGITTSNQFESAFTHRSADLSVFVGSRMQVRFSFVAAGAFYNEDQKFVGFYVDDIALTGVESLLAPAITTVTNSDRSFSFAPQPGVKYYLSARPYAGGRVFPFGPEISVVATNHVTPSALTRFVSIAPASGGKVQMSFKVLTAAASGFQLQQASTLGGAWQPSSGAVLSTNAFEQFVFTAATTAGATGFFRVVAQ
jgi:uncharacterized protein YkwD